MSDDERRLRLTKGSDIVAKAAPWPHYPHCPGCSERLASESQAVKGPVDGRCPYCGVDVGMRSKGCRS